MIVDRNLLFGLLALQNLMYARLPVRVTYGVPGTYAGTRSPARAALVYLAKHHSECTRAELSAGEPLMVMQKNIINIRIHV